MRTWLTTWRRRFRESPRSYTHYSRSARNAPKQQFNFAPAISSSHSYYDVGCFEGRQFIPTGTPLTAATNNQFAIVMQRRRVRVNMSNSNLINIVVLPCHEGYGSSLTCYRLNSDGRDLMPVLDENTEITVAGNQR